MANIYAKVSADTFIDPRIYTLPSSGAVVVWLACLTFCQRHETDGRISLRQLQHELFLCEFIGDLSKIETRLNELVDAKLMRVIDATDPRFNSLLDAPQFEIAGWLDWNRSKDEIDKIRASRAKGGSRGGRPLKTSEGEPHQNLRGFEAQNPYTETETETYIKDIAQPRSGRATVTKVSDSDFEAFYEPYPRHVGRDKARSALGRALKSASIEDIIVGTKRYAATNPHSGCNHAVKQCFVPHPATWLNQGRWMDEPLSTTTTPTPRTTPQW